MFSNMFSLWASASARCAVVGVCVRKPKFPFSLAVLQADCLQIYDLHDGSWFQMQEGIYGERNWSCSPSLLKPE